MVINRWRPSWIRHPWVRSSHPLRSSCLGLLRLIPSRRLSPFWTAKDGRVYYIPKLADRHLFFIVHNATISIRAKRRERIEKLEEVSYILQDNLLELVLKELDRIHEMNTDAYGLEYFPRYKAIMTEAVKRDMREPLNPLYEREPL